MQRTIQSRLIPLSCLQSCAICQMLFEIISKLTSSNLPTATNPRSASDSCKITIFALYKFFTYLLTVLYEYATRCLSEIVGGSGGLTERSLCAVPTTRMRRSCHHDHSRQQFEEDDADPARHAMRSRCAKVPVDDDHVHEDRHDVHDECKQKVLQTVASLRNGCCRMTSSQTM